jgi:hypothetical protein
VQNGCAALAFGNLHASVLPINPTFTIYSAPPVQNECPAISSGDLLTSMLPINPALPAYPESSKQNEHSTCDSGDLVVSKLDTGPAFAMYSTLVSTSTGNDSIFEKNPNPIPSTFPTCRKDLPQHLPKIQKETTLPRISHSAEKPEGNVKAADIPVLSRAPEEEGIRQLNMASRTRNCMVCAEAIPIPEFPALIDCQHDPKVCAVCYKSWIASELESKTWKEIKCPESGCGQLLKHAEVQQYATPEVYKK